MGYIPSWTLGDGARVTKPGGLLFLLMGDVNMQWHPEEVIRIGLDNSYYCTKSGIKSHPYLKKAKFHCREFGS
jgi:hypothetical protein